MIYRLFFFGHLLLSHILFAGTIPLVIFLSESLKIDPSFRDPLTWFVVSYLSYVLVTYLYIFYLCSGNLCLLEVIFLSTNPRKKRTVRYFMSEPKKHCILEFFELFLQLPINCIRSALWILVTATRMGLNVLPMSIRTRATTILRAVIFRTSMEKRIGHRKGTVSILIGKTHRVAEENFETQLEYPYLWKNEKYWVHWNQLQYEPRYFTERDGSRIVVGPLRVSKPGEYTNSMGENKAFHIDTGDRVIMTEAPDDQSSISFLSSSGVQVHLPLNCEQARNLTHWVWQHSIDTVYGALEGRSSSLVDRNTFELDVGLVIFGFLTRLFIYWYFGIVDDPRKKEASDPVSVALLHLSIIAAVYTIRQTYLKDWVKYRGEFIGSELCCLTLPHRGKRPLARALRTIIDTDDGSIDRVQKNPVLIRHTNEDLFIHEIWGIDCSNAENWKVQPDLSENEHSSNDAVIDIRALNEKGQL